MGADQQALSANPYPFLDIFCVTRREHGSHSALIPSVTVADQDTLHQSLHGTQQQQKSHSTMKATK